MKLWGEAGGASALLCRNLCCMSCAEFQAEFVSTVDSSEMTLRMHIAEATANMIGHCN